jgi:hypothetical protein
VAGHVSAAVLHGLPTWGLPRIGRTSPSPGARAGAATPRCTCTPRHCTGTTSWSSTASPSRPRPDRRTVGEFDGKVKYGRLLRPGQELGDAVYAEKLREDAIRAEGCEVVRRTWRDLDAFTAVSRLRDRLRP